MSIQSSATRPTLSVCCAAFLQANSDLVAAILEDIPSDRHAALVKLLAGGGSFGIEALVDQHSNSTISLIGREREGTPVVYAVIQVPALPSGMSANDGASSQR